MKEIKQVKSISIWIFLVPFVALNTCLILITQFHSLFPNLEDVLLKIINSNITTLLNNLIMIYTNYLEGL